MYPNTGRIQATITVLVALLAVLGPARSAAQPLSLVVEVVDASDAERHVNVLIQTRCRLQYLGHEPQDTGSQVSIRLRLTPECGATGMASERPPLTGSSNFVRSVRVDNSGLGLLSIELEWRAKVAFVIAPTTDGRGVRLRLLDALPGQRGRVTIGESDPSSGYAVNLESSTTPIAEQALAESASYLRVPTYVSRLELEGMTFYRLRAGPILARKDAERVLTLAQQRYPRAWLGINDDPGAGDRDVAAVPADVQPTRTEDPALPDKYRQDLMENARKAMVRKDLPRAIELLTKLVRQPEYPQRAAAQELLGLARERSGQLAHAKAEYNEYLRRYPQGEAAARLRYRLRILAGTRRRGRDGTGSSTFVDDGEWHWSGGAMQMYRWERASFDAPEVSTDRPVQNAVYTDGDVVARRRGARFDTVARFSGGYAKDLLSDGPGDVARVSAAFFEMTDRSLGLTGRIGRQTRNSGGLLGTFDGVLATWQWRPKIAFSTAVGFPVESTRESPATDRRFYGVAAEFGPFNDRWDFGAYGMAQGYSGETDRRALGLEARYFVPGRTLVGLVDYDTYFQTINSALLMGSLQLPARWMLSVNIDHRRAPVLTTRNALIGQPVATLDELLVSFSSEQLLQLAQDRTPISDLMALSVSRPLGERFHLSVDTYLTKIDATPSSGGVPATPELPDEKNLQLQLIGSSLWHSNDLWTLAARYQDSDRQTVESVLLATRLPLGQFLRIGPRIRVDRLTLAVDESTQTLYVPGLRLDYQRGGTWIEFEAGAEYGRRTIPVESERTERFYVSLGYRLAF